jgi:hemerythrin-like domain-containing protein
MQKNQQARILTTTLFDAIGKYETGDYTAKSKISAAIRSSIDLHNDHVWRENIPLFPKAEKALPESEINEVTRGYGEIEKRLGTDFCSKYGQLVDALEKTTGVGRGAA